MRRPLHAFPPSRSPKSSEITIYKNAEGRLRQDRAKALYLFISPLHPPSSCLNVSPLSGRGVFSIFKWVNTIRCFMFINNPPSLEVFGLASSAPGEFLHPPSLPATPTFLYLLPLANNLHSPSRCARDR